MNIPAVYKTIGSTHTAIALSNDNGRIAFVTMETLELGSLAEDDFATEYTPVEGYPVRRAAELYLASAKYREILPEVRKRLERIVANPATQYTHPVIPTKEPEIMDKKTTPAKSKTAPKPPAKISAKPAAATAAKPTAPAKVAKPTAPAKAAAPAKVAKPVAAKAPAAPRAVDTINYKVVAFDKPRKGETGVYVAMAEKLKVFTRAKLIDTAVAAGKDAAAARTKVADMVYFKVIAPA